MIDEKHLIEAVRQVAATEPDMVYPAGVVPRYTGRRWMCAPCLVGDALMLAGVPQAVVAKLDDPDLMRDKAVFWGSPAVVRILGGHLTEDAARSVWVRAAQREQDRSATWAEAVAAADELTKEINR